MAEKTLRTCTVGAKIKKKKISSNFRLKFSFNGYLDKFLT